VHVPAGVVHRHVLRINFEIVAISKSIPVPTSINHFAIATVFNAPTISSPLGINIAFDYISYFGNDPYEASGLIRRAKLTYKSITLPIRLLAALILTCNLIFSEIKVFLLS